MLLAVVCGFVSCFVYDLGKKAMLGYMSHFGTNGRCHCRFYVQRGTSAPISWIFSPSDGNCCYLVDMHLFPPSAVRKLFLILVLNHM